MRHRKRSNIIIELTPLLDVIMILIFIIMTNNSNKVIEAEAATERAQTKAEKAAKEYESIISQKDLEYSSALEELNAELENVRVSAEENEAAKDAEIAKLTEDLTIAEARLDLTENLRNIVLQNASKIEGYDKLSEVVKIINIYLVLSDPADDKGYYQETLSCYYSEDIKQEFKPHDIKTYLPKTSNNPNAIKDNAAALEQTRQLLSSFLNLCLKEYANTSDNAEEDIALYIVFTHNDHTGKDTLEMISSEIKSYKDLYKNYNITLIESDSNIINN